MSHLPRGGEGEAGKEEDEEGLLMGGRKRGLNATKGGGTKKFHEIGKMREGGK